MLSIAPFLFLSLFLKLNCYSCLGNASISCPENEKEALLDLKQSLEDPSNKLSSWIGEVSCCNWKGVVCSKTSGHVEQLRLGGYNLTGVKLNSSLLNLKHLEFLDLSANDFSMERIPSFMGSFTHLRYLNLSKTWFYGTVPPTIGNLSHLRTLDLGSGPFRSLVSNNLEWLSGLHRLEHLNMNDVNLSNATNWLQDVVRLPSLVELRLRFCNLNFMSRVDDVNATSLAILDLSFNEDRQSFVPKWIFQLRKLIFLDLSFCFFQGPIPSMSNAFDLQHIDLGSNTLNSTIPDWLYSCKNLQFIDLSVNYLQGTISDDIGNLSFLNSLYLSDNSLSGKIPNSLGNVSNLKIISLARNQLVGAIPTALKDLSSLAHFWLSINKLTGNIPEWLGQLHILERISLDGNVFIGIVSENHFANLTNLKSFTAYGNRLTLKVKHSWVPPFQLTYLALGSWNLGGQIPAWIAKQNNIELLDLSNTGISGTVPSWIWKIKVLYLHDNNLYGKIPDINSTADGSRHLALSSNKFSGPIPRVSDAELLDVSDNFLTGGISRLLCDKTKATYSTRYLLLGGNQLSGELPDCWMKWPLLNVLNLSDNNFFGGIPDSIAVKSLRSLNLYGNKFSGQIPRGLMNCTDLQMINLGDNDLDGSIPTWTGTSRPVLKFLILQSNKLGGEIPSSICLFFGLQVLDLSNNKFSGIIPRCVVNFTVMVKKMNLDKREVTFMAGSFGLTESAFVSTKGMELQYDTILYLVTSVDLSNNNLSGKIPKELMSLVQLRSLNLSGNHFTGLIPDNIGKMEQLESLDLSKNYLEGDIPYSLTNVFSLNYLNLSFNNLTGKIPQGTQLHTFSASSFAGNDLCGPPLTRKCSYGHDEDQDQFPKPSNKEHSEEVEWLYAFTSLGYGMGVSVVCSVMVLNKWWRAVVFGLVEDVWDAISVYCHAISN